MNIMDKVKNLFLEEAEEEPIKSEVIQVEIPAPSVEEEKEEVIEKPIEKPAPLKPPKPVVEEKAPVFFDDSDFKELEKTVPVRSGYLKPQEMAKEEIKKRFQPTPIISPVYGILDKNYHKEEIIDKSKKSTSRTTAKTLDDVRKKAYGSLEDDIETTLFGALPEERKEDLEDLGRTLLDELTTEDVMEQQVEVSVPEEYEEQRLSRLDKEEPIQNSSEMFDMIDAMYEKGDEA